MRSALDKENEESKNQIEVVSFLYCDYSCRKGHRCDWYKRFVKRKN